MKPIRAVAILPTLFTLGNLVSGFFAIVVASRIAKPIAESLLNPAPKLESAGQLLNSLDPTHNLMLCGALIFIAMLFDALDGHVARLAKVTSDFGAQLDSLCDLVTFGVAPGILLVKMCPQVSIQHRELIWTAAALFACCAALRLARFNVEADAEDDHSGFAGLPTPAAAGVIASFAILTYSVRNELHFEDFQTFDYWMQRVLPFFAVLISVLMVSRVPYPHIVALLFRGHRSFAHLIGLVFAIVMIAMTRGFAVPLICVLFVCGPPLVHLRKMIQNHKTREEPLF